MKILIIEDDRTIREYLGKELVNWGYDVFFARKLSKSNKRF